MGIRVIKFRAWHENHKSMIYFNPDKLCKDQYQAANLCRLMRGDFGDVLMQFTGLTVNNIDMYSGDIVKWGHIPGFEEFIPRIAVVKLHPSLNFHTVNLRPNNHAFHYGNFAYAASINKAMEIIGNIHQNPELLK